MEKRYRHIYTEEQKQFLRNTIVGTSYKDLTKKFNQQFGTDLNVGRINSAIGRYGLVNGCDGKFTKGQKTWNKGTKGIHLSPSTEFKKGNIPPKHKPVGSERICKDGYVEVKIAEPNRWKSKHRIAWEAENGQVPKGHVVIFANGNQLDVRLENLLLVSRSELLLMNRHKLIYGDADATRTGLNVAKVLNAARKKQLRPTR